MSLLFLLWIFVAQHRNVDATVLPSDNTIQVEPCDSIPKLNRQLIAYADGVVGKKIGTGECWDFVAAAYQKLNFKWDGHYQFGKVIDPKTECVYPGDVIQFEGVRVEEKSDDGVMVQTMGHHTAIVHKVYGPNNYQLVHQNFGRAGRKVGFTDVDLAHVTKGKYTVYRPVK